MTVVQVRRGTTSEWATANPVLASGEMGYDTTLKDTKMGDGSTLWSNLPFMSTPVPMSYTFEDGNLDGLAGQYGTLSVTTADTESGAYAVEFVSNSTTLDATVLLKEFPVQEGRTYRLTAWAKSGIGTGQQLHWGGSVTKPDNSITFIAQQPVYPTLNASGYSLITYDYTIPTGYDYKGFRPRLNTANTRVIGNSIIIDSINIADITDIIDYNASRAPLSVSDYAAIGDNATNNNTAIASAVSDALADNRELYWPDGIYLTTASIANFHKVRHMGPGAIKRGTDTFYPNPNATQTNTLYISKTGSSSNDGLSASQPLNTLAIAVPLLINYGPFVNGSWVFSLSAGTYTDRTVFPTSLIFSNPLLIKGADVGGHPNVPTTIFSEGYNISASAIIVNDFNESITFQDILFKGYNGTASSMGINIGNCLGTVYTVNCHFTDNYWGMSAIHSLYDMKGGILTRNGYLGDTANTTTPLSARNGNGAGSRSLMQARHSIGLQGAGDNTHGPYFLNNRTGMFVQELCTGHADWVKFEDNERAIDCSVQSRVNVDGSSFKRNGMDLKGSSNSHFYVSANNTFGTGADESDIRIALTSGAQIGDENRLFSNLLPTNRTTMKVLDTAFVNRVVTATTSTVVHTITLAGGMWRDKPNSLVSPKRINIKIVGEMAGTLNSKRCIVRLGNTNVSLVFPAATVGVFEAEANIYLTDRAAQSIIIRGYNHLGSLRIARNTATNDMLSDTNLTTEASVDSAGDSITIYSVDASWGG